MSGKLHAPAALPLGDRVPRTHWIGKSLQGPPRQSERCEIQKKTQTLQPAASRHSE
jgi:hypothetical protein